MVCTIIKLNKIDLYVHIHILQKLINKISEGLHRGHQMFEV